MGYQIINNKSFNMKKQNEKKADNLPINQEPEMSFEMFLKQRVQELYPEEETSDMNDCKKLFVSHYQQLTDTLNDIREFCNRIFVMLGKETQFQKFLEMIENGESAEEAYKKSQINVFKHSNQEKNIEELKQFIQNKSISDEDYARYSELVLGLVEKITNNDFDIDVFEKLWRVYIYEKAVKESFEKGILEGKNQNIELKIKQTHTSDGLCGGEASIPAQNKPVGYIERILQSRK